MNNANNMQNYSYEQKKNNGKGVFYGVIAVATLIVAIIGATFAYFTASARSSKDALSATAAHVEVNYLEGRQLVATNLIPSSATVVAKAYARPTAYEQNVTNKCVHKTDVVEANPESTTAASAWDCGYKVNSAFTVDETEYAVDQIIYSDVYDSLSEENKNKCSKRPSAASTGDVGTKCVDDNGYYVCAVYQFTVTNKSNVKQALQTYMTINSNSFTTVDTAAIAGGATKDTKASVTGNETDGFKSNGALKFMTVRSGNLIDVTAISSDSDATTCANNLYPGTVTQSTKSIRFCNATGQDDANREVFTDTSGSYYYYNTTAVRQSLLDSGKNQTVFKGEILPSINREYLTRSNTLAYMHTASTISNKVTDFGDEDHKVTVSDGSVWADENGYVYESQDACNKGKTFNSECHVVYLSTRNCVNTPENPLPEGDLCVGVYGQVSRTYYIVAWLEENGVSQDNDQDKSFATTINVTSGSIGSEGITGTIK